MRDCGYWLLHCTRLNECSAVSSVQCENTLSRQTLSLVRFGMTSLVGRLNFTIGVSHRLTDVTRLNFFEESKRAPLFSRNSPTRHEVRSSARRTSPLTMVNLIICLSCSRDWRARKVSYLNLIVLNCE